MKYVNIVSDREFDTLASDIPVEARAAAWELWKDDLSTTLEKIDLLNGANSILVYFGSKVSITDVQWDDAENCFLWEIEFDQQ